MTGRLNTAWRAVRARAGTWAYRTPREWLWVIRRRLFPKRAYRVSFDDDMQIQVRLQDQLALHYALGYEFEPDVCAFFRRNVKPGMVVFDVGANIGHFSLLAAKRVGPSGFVHAFEPSTYEYQELSDNIGLNQFANVRTVKAAVCDRQGEITLQVCNNGFGLYNSIGRPFCHIDVVRPFIVSATTLDDYVQSEGIKRVDLVKMDVEGAELLAIQGGASLFGAPDAPVLVCEFSDPAAGAMGHTTSDLRRAIEALGYSIYRFNLKKGILEHEPLVERYDYDNLICIKGSFRDGWLGDAK